MVDGPDDAAYVRAINDPAGDQTAYYFAQDNAEAAKLNQFYPGSSTSGSSGPQWWEQLAAYGATRAIDAHFAPSTTDKTIMPGTYAGQNGRTYAGGAVGGGMGSIDPIILIALAAAAIYALS